MQSPFLDDEQIIEEFIQRRKDNATTLSNEDYIVEEKHLVLRNEKNEVVGSACVLCLNRTDMNPYRNCAPGVSITTICKPCLKHLIIIDDYLKSSGKKRPTTKREMRVEELADNFDFEAFERLVELGTARLTLLAQKYKVTTGELKDILKNKYKSKICFKKGRGGGILWADSTNNISHSKPQGASHMSEQVITVDWDKIDSLLDDNKAKLSVLAREYGHSTADFKKRLISHYGDRIIFRKGRYGGIFWKTKT